MSESAQMIVDVAGRLFADHVDKALLDRAETGEPAQALWQHIVEAGFHEVGSLASGTGNDELFALLLCAGEHAVPLPLAETMLGNAWISGTPVLTSIGMFEGGIVKDVPWGRAVGRVIGITEGSSEVTVADKFVVARQKSNLAGEPRDDISLSGDEVMHSLDVDPYALLCLSRCVQMAGGLRTVLSMSLGYASEREQFGRTISKFQAIQHTLAAMAAETAAACRAADVAIAASSGPAPRVAVAAAKSRIGEAVGIVAELAHQVHGAMGFTYEHKLHHLTRRLWAARDEYGNETTWQEALGRQVAGVGADGVWDFLTART